MRRAELERGLLLERGELCEECGKRRGVQVNHWWQHRMVGRERWLDVMENCGLVCEVCHYTGACHTRESKRRFWDRQVARGYDMRAWVASLPPELEVKQWE